MPPTSTNRRLAKNTLMLYVRTFITMLVGLFTVRVIFNALGEVDYGIQNVVSGFVAMVSFVTGSLSVAFSRFFSIELGRADYDKLRQTFATSLSIVFIVGLALCMLIEPVGLYFINHKMSVPPERLHAALVVFHLSVATLFVNTVSIPYDAIIISREHMSAYAYISIFEVTLKLIIALCLLYFTWDHLILYSILLLLQALVVRWVYSAYCRRRFPETEFRLSYDRKLIKQIGSIVVWDLWGSSAHVLKNYGVNLLLNVYCGVAVNAARGIAMQVNMVIARFSNGFLTAMRPHITKSYISRPVSEVFAIADTATKISSYLVIYFAVPLILESGYLLQLWLGDVPQHAVAFTNLIIILSLTEGTMAYCYNAVIMANGNIRACQFVTGFIQLLNIPICWWLLSRGAAPTLTVVVAIAISLLTCFIRVAFLRRLTGYKLRSFIAAVFIPVTAVFALGLTASWLLASMLAFQNGLLRLVVVTLGSIALTSLLILTVGTSRTEKQFIRTWLKNRFTHKNRP